MIDDRRAPRRAPSDWAARPRVQGGHLDRLRHRARGDGLPGLRRQRVVPRAQALARAHATIARSTRSLTHRLRSKSVAEPASPCCITVRRSSTARSPLPARARAATGRRSARCCRTSGSTRAASSLAHGLPRRGEARERRRAAPAEADRRQPRRATTAALARAARAARRLRPAAPVDDGVHRAARVPVRQGHAARGAQDRAAGVPPSARAVAALPPRAADRRPHARRRARPARHLDADQLHAVLDPADARRDRARGRRSWSRATTGRSSRSPAARSSLYIAFTDRRSPNGARSFRRR